VVDEVEDEFICFSIDPGLDEQKWLEAFQVVPESLEVVHHVLVGIDPSGESETLAGEDGVYECFGGFGVDATFIGGWIPGSSPIEMPEQSALRITEDARIVIQMHYHLAAQPYTDATGLALRWADSTPVREAYFELVGNANAQQPDGTGLQPGPNDEEEATFYIPPGASDHTETMALQIFDVFPRSTHVFLVANHMHYVGTDMRMWVERGSEAPESDEACLLHTPQWDFDWQQFYQYDLETQGGPEIYPDDTLWLECHYDNTLDNPGVASALSEAGEDAPLAVTLGEGSLDEMCIGVLGQVIDVEMEVENPTHEGELSALVTSEGYGFELTACEGPASVEVDAAGALYGRAACGLDALGMLITLEFEFNGSMDIAQGGEGSGPILMEVIGLDGAIEGTWEGEVIEDGLQVGFSLTGDLGGPEVSLEAELWLPLVESF
jgi:hypothetical protein